MEEKLLELMEREELGKEDAEKAALRQWFRNHPELVARVMQHIQKVLQDHRLRESLGQRQSPGLPAQKSAVRHSHGMRP